jgi:hypothetical protein
MAPSWVNKPHEKEKWEKPWTVDPASTKDKDFKAKCWEHGLLSPHFTRAEAASNTSGSSSCQRNEPIPESLRAKAQYHAFKLERVRHALGDKPLRAVSWYRSPCHNAAVGGASLSQHKEAWATDWNSTGDAFDRAMEFEFSNGGRGYQGFVGGRVRHVDNGPARTWVY